MGTRLAVGLLWLLRLLPLALLAPLGAGLGMVAYALLRERREVCLVNLERCFPDLAAPARRGLARRHFRALGRSVLERGILWWSRPARIERLVRIEDRHHWDDAGRPVIWLVPHFVALDAAATRLNILTEAVSIYSAQKDPYLNRLLIAFRARFNPVELFSRQDGLRGVVRAIRRGLPFYYLPDMDFGPRDAVFVPFFGVPAATVTGLSRIARLTGAKVVPLVARMLPGAEGYAVRFYPAWENFPGGDDVADARRVNAFIEDRVREAPEQYYWVHKRFKTRPPGEPKFYD